MELKRPGIPISDTEKSQTWKYATELLNKGLLRPDSTVTCFVLGSAINPADSGKTTHRDGLVNILPLDYDTVIRRAKSRLLNLYDKIKSAPYLQDTRTRMFLLEKSQMELQF